MPVVLPRARRAALGAFSTVALINLAPPAMGAEQGFYEIETKYIFGFTEGSGVGLEGEREFSPETVARFGKRDGRYTASETKLEYEFTPNQWVQIEFGPLVSYHDIRGVSDLDDAHAGRLSGFFGELRYLAIERTSSSPLAVTVSVEPEWHRIDETGGERVTNFGLETKINADIELVKNRAYLGFNLLYEPETTRNDLGGWDNESTAGVSAALAYRLTPQVTVGAEVWYLRHYDGAWLNALTGDAVFVGPTLYVQLTRKMFMTAAWNTQIAGREITDAGSLNLNLAEFSRHRAKLKFAVEF